MPPANDPERQATQILENAHWLQAIICQGCTNLCHDKAEITDGGLVFSNPHCLNPDCAGHDPVAAYLKALPVAIYMMGKEVFFASTD